MLKGERQFNGEALCRLRRERGLTQAQLAKQAGRSRNIVNRAETQSKCSPESAKRLADAMGIPLEGLLEDPASRSKVLLTKEQSRVVQVMGSSPEATQAIWHFALGVESAGSGR